MMATLRSPSSSSHSGGGGGGRRRVPGGLERRVEFLSRKTSCRYCVRAEAAASSSPGESAESVFSSVPREALDMEDRSGRLKRKAKVYYTRAGERLLFQFGESMRRFEVPEGTRVIYPGVRKDGERNIDKGMSCAEKERVCENILSYPPRGAPITSCECIFSGRELRSYG